VRTIAVDWSGARDPRRTLWLAEACAGELVRIEAGRTREELVEHLLEEAARDPALVVGLDFAFGFPEWFARAPEAWTRAAADGEAWLRDPRPPFWRGKRPPPQGDDFRRTDREVGGAPQSVFKLVGAGQVGTGSLRGMPFLPRLRERFAIWPFDEPRLPLLVEIYPRLVPRLEGQPNEHARDAASTAAAMSRFDGWTALPRDDAYLLEGRIWSPALAR
jgi:hypothetical protein